jgi:chemotaxis protein MotB
MATNAAPIIVKKIKKAGHGGHHGGAWKVAYADFVTAMMAFFLLLWLLNSTTQEQRSGISEYFSAESVARTTSGAGGVLGGQTITLDGPKKGKGAPLGLPVPLPNEDKPETDAEVEDPTDGGNEGGAKEEIDAKDMAEVLAKREDKTFEQAEQAIKQAIQTIPSLARLADSLAIDRTEEGLRIQLIDQKRTSMFASGSSVPYQHTRQLLEIVAKVVAKLPNKIAIAGHTDATPYRRGAGYSNWELSTDRALASRRELAKFGLKNERVTRVTGRAATEAFIPTDPTSPRNRRISITLLRQTPPPPKVGTTDSPAGAITPPPVAPETNAPALRPDKPGQR